MSNNSAPRTARQGVLEQLASRITGIRHPHPVRVAVDGVDAAGKTTLAGELARVLAVRGLPVITASIDGFHRPRRERYARGEDSPEGYYDDSFDYPALRDALLTPLGPGGSRRYYRAVFDFRTDSPVASDCEQAPVDAVLLFDGVFLLRPELEPLWDYRIFVDVPLDVAVRRALVRDQPLFGSADAVRERYLRRYVPAQRLYLSAVHPERWADAIVRNADPDHPSLILRG